MNTIILVALVPILIILIPIVIPTIPNIVHIPVPQLGNKTIGQYLLEHPNDSVTPFGGMEECNYSIYGIACDE